MINEFKILQVYLITVLFIIVLILLIIADMYERIKNIEKKQ